MTAQMNNSEKIRKITFLGMMTAMVLILQQLAIFTRPLFPAFTITLVLVPIVLGSVVCGKIGGAWLGAAFGIAVFITHDADAFLTLNPFGTIVTVMAKGIFCGFAAALVYQLFSKKNIYLGVFLAAVACPVVNTGVFLVGSVVFFMDAISAWAAAEGVNVFEYMLFGFVGVNFVVELAINIVLAPVIIRLISIIPVKNGK